MYFRQKDDKDLVMQNAFLLYTGSCKLDPLLSQSLTAVI